MENRDVPEAAVGVGGTMGQFPADEIEKFFLYNFIETVAKVTGQGPLRAIRADLERPAK